MARKRIDMSNEFVRLNYYRPADSMQTGFTEEELAKVHGFADNYIFIGVPKQEEYGVYFKTLIECAINLTAKTSSKADITRREPDKHMTESGIDEDMLIAVREVATIMQYITNSASWRLGELKDYDASAIGAKLIGVGQRLKAKVKKD